MVMNRKIKSMRAGFLALAVALTVLLSQAFPVFAASGQLTFSDPSVSVGNQVSVTMRISADAPLGASDVMLGYDSSALEFVSGTNANGGAGSIRVVGSMEEAGQTDFRFTLTFKALKAGATTISVNSYEVYDADSQTVSLSHVGSSAVTVNAPDTYSDDASLSSLTVSPGELSPAFSPETTEYSVTVPADVERLTVSAPANDSGASVSISGNEGLQMGENTVTCQVTAEDGTTTRTYTILVTKTEEAPQETEESSAEANAVGSGVQVTVDEGTWQVAGSFDAAALPQGFTQTEITYEGTQVQAGTDSMGTILLYMTDENGNGDFFVYDAEKGILSPYVTISMSERTIVVLPPERLPEELTLPDGFMECTIDIGEHTVHGWIWENSGEEAPEYCVVYGMNEDGEENLYRYDQKEMTIQRYFQDPAAEEIRGRYVQVAEDYNSLLEDYNVRGYLIAGLFGVSILLVIILVIVLLTRKPGGPKDGGSRGPEREADRFQERPEPLSGSRVRKPAQEESRRPESRTAEPRVSESPTRAEQPEQSEPEDAWEDADQEDGLELLDLEADVDDEEALDPEPESRKAARESAAAKEKPAGEKPDDEDLEMIDLD